MGMVRDGVIPGERRPIVGLPRPYCRDDADRRTGVEGLGLRHLCAPVAATVLWESTLAKVAVVAVPNGKAAVPYPRYRFGCGWARASRGDSCSPIVV